MNKTIRMKNATLSLIMIALFLGCIPVISFAGSWNGWIYQDPYPTSNMLMAVKFVTPKKGWVAGEVGTILYTEDGGETWETQESGTEQKLSSIFFVNEKIGWAVGEQGIIIHTDDGGKSWVTQAQTHQFLLKIYFINDHDGWAAGHDAILHTTDGGKKWVRQDTGITGTIASIFYINPRTGWVLAGGAVYSTQDGGGKWDKTYLPQSEYPAFGAPGLDLGDIYFTDDKNGWAVVGFGLIFYTNDGGKTWANQLHTEDSSSGLSRISFLDAKRGCATGSSIFCTDDGGITWIEKSIVTSRKGRLLEGYWLGVELYGVSFLGGTSLGWAAGKDGQIMKTEDGGKTWKMIARKDECGRYYFFVNKKTGWFHDIDLPLICRTDDGGATRRNLDMDMNVNGVFFADEMTGWAVGSRKKPEGKQRPGRKPGKVWAVIEHTTDGGKTWETQYEELVYKDLFYRALIGIYFADRNTGWAVGSKGIILHTEDGGKHWKRQEGASSESDLLRVKFVNPKIGWIVGMVVDDEWTGIILNTKDGGNHWQTQYRIKDIGLTGLHFIDNKIGWATGLSERGDSGWLLHTVDGGNKWTKEELGDIGYSDDMAFLDKQRGVISADKGWLFITTDGGKHRTKIRRPIRTYPWHFSEIFEKKSLMPNK